MEINTVNREAFYSILTYFKPYAVLLNQYDLNFVTKLLWTFPFTEPLVDNAIFEMHYLIIYLICIDQRSFS